MFNLPKKYNHKEIEKRIQEKWQKQKTYKWQNDLPKNQTFVIDTPPPTVSGLLHMGHIFSYTQADFIARYKRMKGFDVFYPMGFDDNGLPTERLVEKVIGKKAGAYEAENGRGSFVKQCQKIIDEAEIEFENLFNSIALSVDWEQKYQTISKESQQLSQASFVDLFNKGLVERRFAPVLWDPVDRTALSQADLVDKEMPSAMYEIEFTTDIPIKPSIRSGIVRGLDSLKEDKKIIKIATTRPELLPACVAVMIHPEDARYQNLIKENLNQDEGFTGSYAITALFGVKVPIIADKLVQMDKGTGAVMCCTFGDETDIKWWQKHQLPLKVIIGKDGRYDWQKICDLVNLYRLDDDINIYNPNNSSFTKKAEILFEKGKGKTLKEGKEIIIETLKNIRSNHPPLDGKSVSVSESVGGQSFLIKSTPITHAVKCAERSGAPIEILVQPQWFVKILDKKEELKAKARECNWYPNYMRIRIEQWIDNLAWDWCISRQRYFGVPFPIWYSKRKGEEGKILVADFSQLPVDPQKHLPCGYSNDEVQAETDIMDTWATSSISPQLSSKGISNDFFLDKERHKKLFPADIRPQAHEIIRTWAFYTIAKSMLHEDKIPWKNLMISGWCLAADKTKMSKSKGNVITPQNLIEEKGADIVRYWASASNLGADISYSEDLFKIGSKLITKLFNASKFVALNFSDLKITPTNAKTDVENGIINKQSDFWILSRLFQTIKKSEEEFDKFEYAKARQIIEDFFWNDFCDNYLEIIKVRSYGIKAIKYENITLTKEQKEQIIQEQQSALTTLYHCLEAVLKLLAPILPHITEEIYQAIFTDRLNSIHQRGSWPDLNDHIKDNQVLEVGEIMKEVIFIIRKFKSDNNISIKTDLASFRINSKIDISGIISDLSNVCNVKEIIVRNNQNRNLVEDIMLFS